MGSYDVQQVCLNGHQITDCYNRSPEFRKNFCDKCGERTIHECPECHHPIKGYYNVENVISMSETPIPSHCENCGKPYPWSVPKSHATSQSFPDDKDLHPWPIIQSYLQELSSDEISRIIGMSGLQVDWNLTEEQAYSHSTRKRAYLPRIQSAYNSLSDEKKLTVAWLVAKELKGINPELVDRVNSQLSLIGWEIGGNGLMIHDVDIREIFFPSGKQYDAYVKIRGIIQKASTSLFIIDPYIDSTVFQLLSSTSSSSLKTQILTYNLSTDFVHETHKFLSQYSQITIDVRKTKEFHDRFIICDNSECFHIGASIKDAGKKAFMISKIEDANNIRALIQQLQTSWNNGSIVSI